MLIYFGVFPVRCGDDRRAGTLHSAFLKIVMEMVVIGAVVLTALIMRRSRGSTPRRSIAMHLPRSHFGFDSRALEEAFQPAD